MKRLGNPGDLSYDAYVGPPEQYDFMGATQFRLLAAFGLREHHKVLDVGCGSLRVGRLLIPFLNTGCYFGIEPNAWLIEEAKKNEVGHDLFSVKEPSFDHNSDFEIPFDVKFDYIIAQSIFSHTGTKLFERAIERLSKNLNDNGLIFATFVDYMDEANDEQWYYPECVGLHHTTIIRMARRNNLACRRLRWMHPRQTWYLFSRSARNIPSSLKLMSLTGDVVNCPEFKHFRIKMTLRRYWYVFESVVPRPVSSWVKKLILRFRNR
ncbi:MAG: class I SAM-dependent methyltransferase [Alphaproteobacteria bacterium]|nr:class I SAM-dependent methyltransferase [Alphaproteobacteria bacterium]